VFAGVTLTSDTDYCYLMFAAVTFTSDTDYIDV
jgi:hypothetical protein